MPFGEELGGGTGGRTTGMGFSNSGDTNRKKFTGYERDNEAGLDFGQARYYGNTQGRFTSPDPLMSSGKVSDPQSWNRYSYCLNNPVVLTDASGMEVPKGPVDSQAFIGAPRETPGDIDVFEGTQYTNGQQIQERTVTLTYQVTVPSTLVPGATIQVDIQEQYKETISMSSSGHYTVNSSSTSAVSVFATAVVGNVSQENFENLNKEAATVKEVTQGIVEVSRSKGFDPMKALAIAAEETHLGISVTDPANAPYPAKAPAVNPLQLSGNRENMDRKHNISGAIDDFVSKSRGGTRSFRDTMDNYGGYKYPHSVVVASDYLDSIRSSSKTEYSGYRLLFPR